MCMLFGRLKVLFRMAPSLAAVSVWWVTSRPAYPSILDDVLRARYAYSRGLPFTIIPAQSRCNDSASVNPAVYLTKAHV